MASTMRRAVPGPRLRPSAFGVLSVRSALGLTLSAGALVLTAPGPTTQSGPSADFAGGGLCDAHLPGGCGAHAAHTAGPDRFGRVPVPGATSGRDNGRLAAHSSACPAGDARENGYSPPYEVGIDYIPLSTDGTVGIHVVYSGKDNGNGTGTSLNSNIYLFEQTDGGLLIFGGGYGDPNGPYTALNDADFDVANIDAVVRQCLGKHPATTPVDFVWPHWHGDHGNDEFIHSLEDAGYDIRSIGFHEGDSSFIYGFGWNPGDTSKFVEFPDGGCNVPIATYDTTVGPVWFSARSGHTAGSIDLVIDVRGNERDRFQIRGSVQGTECPNPPDGLTDQIEAHNNVVLTNLPQVVPFGCINPEGSLTHISGTPKPNQLQTLGIDDPTGSVAPGALTYLLASTQPDRNMPCGTSFQTLGTSRPFELLLDVEAALALSDPIPGPTWTGPGTPAQLSARIPADATLQGTSLYLQGYLVNPGAGAGRRLALTDGLELRIR